MAEGVSHWTNVCCNPFGKPSHFVRNKKQLRQVSNWMIEKVPSLTHGQKICASCRKQLAQTSTPSPTSEPRETTPELVESPDERSELLESPDEGPHSEPDPAVVTLCGEELQPEPSESVSLVNMCLETFGETPITKTKLKRSKKRSKQKVDMITTMMQKAVISKRPSCSDCEIVSQLREKFPAATRSEKMQILTVLPKSWSVKRIQEEFNTTNFMARQAKELVKEKGVLAMPDLKRGHALAEQTVHLVHSFYQSDEISRVMPGRKDYISVREGEGRVHVQKRLVLCNLKELYAIFKDQHPSDHIGFSKFASLRPKHCVLAGASGTHTVCVCTYHQNVKLMIHAAELDKSHKHIIAQAVCNPPQPKCYLDKCTACPGTEMLRESMTIHFEKKAIDNVIYQQWVSVDRTTLETASLPFEDFIEAFIEKVEVLIPHSFIATQQAQFFSECKKELKEGELAVVADFSENYSFVVQDAAQGMHWNNSQATIHPFVVYYQHSNEEHHISFVVISDCLQHDTVAVHLFQRALITFLKSALPFADIKKIMYFSDGAASQYKNRKNFVNLCSHEADFGIKAEWHFSATSHGKGACDGVGGTVKRLAARASLQRPYDQQIMSPTQLYQWAKENIPATVFRYCSTEEYEVVKQELEKRFQNSRTIPGTRKLHAFIPLSKHLVAVKLYSNSGEYKIKKVVKDEEELELDGLSGFVTCAYKNEWWLACILNVDPENAEVKVTFLYPHGPARSYYYPSIPDILSVPITDLLARVSPNTAPGHTYTITQKESRESTKKLISHYN